MNNITGGVGGGGLSGTLDGVRPSQVSGCHRVASNPAAMVKQVFVTLVSFLMWVGPGVTPDLEEAAMLCFKRSRHCRKNTLLPRKLCVFEAGTESDFHP